MKKEITSAQNSLMKYIKSLHNKKGRQESGAFWVEGFRNVQEALRHGVGVKKIIVMNKMEEKLAKIRELIKGIEIVTVPEKLFHELSTTVTPQGVALIAEIPSQDINMLDYKSNKSLVVAIDSLQDPGNLGTIIRTSSAANVDAVLVGKGTVDPYSPKVVRATMGSIFQVPIIYCENLSQTLYTLKFKKCYKIVTGHIEAENYYFKEDLTGNCVLVVGNENQGPSSSVLAISDKIVKIPLLGSAESLNASLAAGILIYESIRQRLLVGV